MNYLIWDVTPGPKVCRLGSLQNVDKDFQLRRGISRVKAWPENASYFMDKDMKEHIRIEDSLWNIGGLLVVSSKVKDLLEPEKLKNNEFLSIQIYNHKDRPLKEMFFILNQIVLQDCIDTGKSVFERNDLDPELFSIIEELVIDENRIDPEVSLFRMEHYPRLAIIRRDIAERILASQLTGITFQEAADFSDLD
jgi:hypothetical protein